MERLGLQPMPAIATALAEYFAQRPAFAASQAR
jgi:hypothetical protein